MRLRIALLLALAAAPALAQTGTIRGRALADDGTPVPLSVVRLLPGTRSVLTDAQGAFRFDTVAAGAYRLQMERIGYTAPPSAPFSLTPGETRDETLRAAFRSVMLEGVSNGPPACYTRDRLGEAPAVQALWSEAKKGVEQRRAFAAQYAWRVNMHTRARAHLRLVRDKNIESDTVVIEHPDSARARRARDVARGDTVQRSSSLMIQVPSELTLLRDDFLVGHCLEANPQRDPSGAYVLRFRAVRAPRDSLTLSGALRIDERTFAVREVEFRYSEGRRMWAMGTTSYADVSTPFGPIRFPRLVTLDADPSGPQGMIVTRIAGTVEYHGYRDFQRVR